MAKVLVNESPLTGIANAIRGKNGETTTYKPSEMAAAITAISGGGEPTIEALSITTNGTYTAPDGVDGYSPVTVNVPQDGGPPESAFVISGDCGYRFANGGWDWFLKQYGNRLTTENINNASYMFQMSNIETIPFEINFGINHVDLRDMFSYCKNLIEIPKLVNLKPEKLSSLFVSCNKLRTISNDFMTNWNWDYLSQQTSNYIGDQSKIFGDCFSLRSIPIDLIANGNPYINYNYSYFNYGFANCFSLDKLVNLPITYNKAKWPRNAFNSTFDNCNRLKNITFAKQDDGTPYTVSWKNQNIVLSFNVGYAAFSGNILGYNSGITADKEVTDDATYQALKNDPDWFTTNVAYSRYNHDSAVATINSLPDTSAYLTSTGGTNTIKFRAIAGSATDGGAINTLTEEEIAVATAKGWTVTLV